MQDCLHVSCENNQFGATVLLVEGSPLNWDYEHWGLCFLSLPLPCLFLWCSLSAAAQFLAVRAELGGHGETISGMRN